MALYTSHASPEQIQQLQQTVMQDPHVQQAILRMHQLRTGTGHGSVAAHANAVTELRQALHAAGLPDNVRLELRGQSDNPVLVDDGGVEWGNIAVVAGVAVLTAGVAGGIAAGAGGGAGGGAGAAGGAGSEAAVDGTISATTGGGVGAGGGGTVAAVGGAGATSAGFLNKLRGAGDVAANLSPVLSNAAQSSAENQQLNNSQALANSYYRTQAPRARLATAARSSVMSNAQPVHANWGGPGSGLRGETVHYDNALGPQYLNADARHVADTELSNTMQQSLRAQNGEDLPDPGATSTMDKILGGASMATSLLGAFRNRRPQPTTPTGA